MTEQKRTEIFPMHVKPVHIGVYEHLSSYDQQFYFSLWDGEQWCGNSHTVEYAAEQTMRSIAAYERNTPGAIIGWRGLAEKPE